MYHGKHCEAPICAQSITKEEMKYVIWYAGEKVCGHRQYRKFQKKQALINRYFEKGLFKYPERYWTATMLEKRTYVMKAKGGNPTI